MTDDDPRRDVRHELPADAYVGNIAWGRDNRQYVLAPDKTWLKFEIPAAERIAGLEAALRSIADMPPLDALDDARRCRQIARQALVDFS